MQTQTKDAALGFAAYLRGETYVRGVSESDPILEIRAFSDAVDQDGTLDETTRAKLDAIVAAFDAACLEEDGDFYAIADVLDEIREQA